MDTLIGETERPNLGWSIEGVRLRAFRQNGDVR